VVVFGIDSLGIISTDKVSHAIGLSYQSDFTMGYRGEGNEEIVFDGAKDVVVTYVDIMEDVLELWLSFVLVSGCFEAIHHDQSLLLEPDSIKTTYTWIFSQH